MTVSDGKEIHKEKVRAPLLRLKDGGAQWVTQMEVIVCDIRSAASVQNEFLGTAERQVVQEAKNDLRRSSIIFCTKLAPKIPAVF